jgi:hypothetical protein
MKLYIDPTGGIAGDMFAAALISAGADKAKMIAAMTMAAEKLGPASVNSVTTGANATRMEIRVDHKHGHLSGTRARELLEATFDSLDLKEPYRSFGFQGLQILLDAEIKAHREHHFPSDHTHDHHHEEDAYLHEAQDILIDITGAAVGLYLLQASVKARLLAPVSLGGGFVRFSHGRLQVPAPATANIIKHHQIASVMGPIDTELCTPTGAAILAALGAGGVNDQKEELILLGTSRGEKELPIPPLKIFSTSINRSLLRRSASNPSSLAAGEFIPLV